MKYIKTYENINEEDKMYWRIPIENVAVALDKIGVPKIDQEYLLTQYKDDITGPWKNIIRKDYMYVGCDLKTLDTQWYYNTDNEQDEYFNIGYIKQPNIELTQQDIENWEIKNNIKKYNI